MRPPFISSVLSSLGTIVLTHVFGAACAHRSQAEPGAAEGQPGRLAPAARVVADCARSAAIETDAGAGMVGVHARQGAREEKREWARHSTRSV